MIFYGCPEEGAHIDGAGVIFPASVALEKDVVAVFHSFHEKIKFICIPGCRKRSCPGDDSLFIQLKQCAVERDHFLIDSGFQRDFQRIEIAVADLLFDRCRAEQNFDSRVHAGFIGTRKKALGDDCLKGESEICRELFTLGLRKHGHEPLNGLNRIGRVHRGDDEVPGHGGGDCDLDGLHIAHFSDDDHIRVFPQSELQGLRKTAGGVVDFPLGNE